MSEDELVQRLERLEKDNRRLKHIALAALVLLGAAVGLGAGRATPGVPGVIKAREFDVVNAAGATVAQMSTVEGRPRLQLRWPQGYQMILGSTPYPNITLRGPGGQSTLLAGGKIGTVMHGPEILLMDPHGAGIDLQVKRSGPGISLGDTQGFSMALGTTNAVTSAKGKTQQTSAASIVMFKDRHVIWQAPEEGDSK
jgi:hypothetical protein